MIKIRRDSTKGEIVNVDYAREYGIDVEVLRLEHPVHPGQVGLALAHEAMSRDVWVEVARVRKEREARARYLSAQTPVEHFDLDLAERVLLAQAIPVELPDWVPTFIIKCLMEYPAVVEAAPEAAKRGKPRAKRAKHAYTFTAKQLMQAHLALDRRESDPDLRKHMDTGR